jgi:capsular polysaccharide biosynthesis protein
MDLALFARMVLRRGWIVIVCTAVGLAGAVAVAAARTPVYGAVTRVKAQPARPTDLGQTQAIREIMASYMRDIRTYDMASAVSARLCGSTEALDQQLCRKLDPGALRGMIETSADANVFEIRIKARSTDPVAAVKVSEQTAHAFVDRREKADRKLDLSDRVLVEIRESPEPTRDSPRRKLYAAAGAVLGALCGVFLMLLLEFIERAVILNGGDAARALAVPVLGRIPGGGQRSRRLPAGRSGAPARLAVHVGRAAALVVALAALGGVLALLLSRAQDTLYVARTRIAVEPARGSDWGQSQAIREITRGFSEDIHTTGMAQEVNDRLQLDLPAADLLRKVHVAPEVDVYEITVEAFDPDPQVASAISQEWGSLFVERRGIANLELDQSDRILTRLRDRTETELWSPKTSVNTIAGLFIGAMVGLGALYVVRLSRSAVVASPDSAAASARAPVLGAVPPHESGLANRRIDP